VSKIVLASLLLVATAGVAQAALSVDGSIADWPAASKFSDPDGDQSDHIDILEWGAKFEGGYLYTFCRIEQMIDNDGDGVYDAGDGDMNLWAGGTEYLFPGLWIDADGLGEDDTGGTYIMDHSTNCADWYKHDHQDQYVGGDIGWGDALQRPDNATHDGSDGLQLHEGIDINWEWGSDGKDYTSEYLNYWGGTNDDVGDCIRNSLPAGDYAFLGKVYEARVLVSDLWDAIRDNVDGALGDTGDVANWKVAMACQGYKGSCWTWGYDVTVPQTIELFGDLNKDGLVNTIDFSVLLANWTGSPSSGAGGMVPEPVTVSLLALGGLALLRRRR
jgi:hypothetical protein